MCGEKPDRILWEHWKEGSPPRMRGKEKERAEFYEAIRITPAYAGKRILLHPALLLQQDHPRTCGEK